MAHTRLKAAQEYPVLTEEHAGRGGGYTRAVGASTTRRSRGRHVVLDPAVFA